MTIDFKTPREREIFERAVLFTAVRGVLSVRTREEFPSLEDAVAYGAEHGDRRTMIYAVDDLGATAHICNA